MLQLYKYEGGTFRRYIPSAQTHCGVLAVEKWIQEAADEDGAIHNVSIEIHGTSIPLTHAKEAYVIAALFAADHNDYVTRNLNYAIDVSSESPDVNELDVESISDSDDIEEMDDLKLQDDYEQNEDCIVNDFGPSHARDTDW